MNYRTVFLFIPLFYLFEGVPSWAQVVDPIQERYGVSKEDVEARVAEVLGEEAILLSSNVALIAAFNIAVETLRSKQGIEVARASMKAGEKNRIFLFDIVDCDSGCFDSKTSRPSKFKLLSDIPGFFELITFDFEHEIFQTIPFEMGVLLVMMFGDFMTEGEQQAISELFPRLIQNSEELMFAKSDFNCSDWREDIGILFRMGKDGRRYRLLQSLLIQNGGAEEFERVYQAKLPSMIGHEAYPSHMHAAQGGFFKTLEIGLQHNGKNNVFAAYVGKPLRDIPRDLFESVGWNISESGQPLIYHRTDHRAAATQIVEGNVFNSLKGSPLGGASSWGEGVYGSLSSNLYHYGVHRVQIPVNPDAIIGRDIDIFNGKVDGYVVVIKVDSAWNFDAVQYDPKRSLDAQEPGINRLVYILEVSADDLTRDERKRFMAETLDLTEGESPVVDPLTLYAIGLRLRKDLDDELSKRLDQRLTQETYGHCGDEAKFSHRTRALNFSELLRVAGGLDSLNDVEVYWREMTGFAAIKVFLTHYQTPLTTLGIFVPGWIAESYPTVEYLLDLLARYRKSKNYLQRFSDLDASPLIENEERRGSDLLREVNDLLDTLLQQEDISTFSKARLIFLYRELLAQGSDPELEPIIRNLLDRIAEPLIPVQEAFFNDTFDRNRDVPTQISAPSSLNELVRFDFKLHRDMADLDSVSRTLAEKKFNRRRLVQGLLRYVRFVELNTADDSLEAALQEVHPFDREAVLENLTRALEMNPSTTSINEKILRLKGLLLREDAEAIIGVDEMLPQGILKTLKDILASEAKDASAGEGLIQEVRQEGIREENLRGETPPKDGGKSKDTRRGRKGRGK